MKVTHNWLKDFVEIKAAPQVLADKLTMAGLEVTSLEGKGGDFVFEIEVTSNRPDCLSVIGIAREVAAILGHRLKVIGDRLDKKYLQPTAYSLQPFSIKIENKKDCPLYTAKIIRGVEVGPSPEWLKRRLELVGCRSVNNIVDITNYILFTYGEPLHAFDLDRLSGNAIIVRRAKEGEKIINIDGEQRMLSPDSLVIADKEKPVAIAGIMGGKDTEVTEATKNILLEAAIFNPIIVRRGRQKLGVQSESSYRFERGICLETAELASWQAIKLIQEICGGRFVFARSSALPNLKKRKINLDVAVVHKILGENIGSSKIKSILNSLDFKVKPGLYTAQGKSKLRKGGAKPRAKNFFVVEIPPHRPDINLEIDLIEEIARIYGYERLSKTVPRVSPYITASDTRGVISLIKNILVGLGLNEVITYSLIDEGSLKGFCEQPDELIEIANPLSQEQEALRPLLMPSLSQCVAYNLRQKQGYINVFEIAKTYTKTKDKVSEQYVLGIALCGTKSGWGWVKEEAKEEYKEIQEDVRLEYLKGILETLLQRLGFKYSFKEKERGYRFISSGNGYAFEVELRDRETDNYFNIGILKKLQREILERLDIKNKEVFVAEINLDKLCRGIRIDKEIKPPLRYPGISRDTTFELKEEITLEQIYDAIALRREALLEEAHFTAFFKGPQVPAGHKRITISFRYYSAERTLTEAEINAIHAKLVKGMQERFQAKIC